MAENADHNAMTIDGKGSMHAMGCISSTTYNGEYTPQRNLKPVPRQQRKSVNGVESQSLNIYHQWTLDCLLFKKHAD